MLLNTSKVQKITDRVFKAVRGLTKSVKFHHWNGSAYSASAGGFSGSSFETIPADVIVKSFRSSEVDGEQVLTNDKQIIVPASVLGGRVPTANDKVEIDSQLWTVVQSTTDAASSAYIIQIRQ